jgi:hypothetical protein
MMTMMTMNDVIAKDDAGPTRIKNEDDNEPTKVDSSKISDDASKNSDGEETGVGKSEDKSIEDGGEGPQRYLPKNKKPDAALTFPEKVRWW